MMLASFISGLSGTPTNRSDFHFHDYGSRAKDSYYRASSGITGATQ
jgi:hypothetical protein